MTDTPRKGGRPPTGHAQTGAERARAFRARRREAIERAEAEARQRMADERARRAELRDIVRRKARGILEDHRHDVFYSTAVEGRATTAAEERVIADAFNAIVERLA